MSIADPNWSFNNDLISIRIPLVREGLAHAHLCINTFFLMFCVVLSIFECKQKVY